jgi:uncharacterized protein YjbI with pentapeptide repeats
MEPLDPLLPNSDSPNPVSSNPKNSLPEPPNPDPPGSAATGAVRRDQDLRTREDAEEWLVETNADSFAFKPGADDADHQHASNDAEDGLPSDNRDYLTSDHLPRQVRLRTTHPSAINFPEPRTSLGSRFGEIEITPPELGVLGKLPIEPGMTIALATVSMLVGLAFDSLWLGVTGAIISLGVSIGLLLPSGRQLWVQLIPEPWRVPLIAALGLMASSVGLLMLGSSNQQGDRAIQINWDALGALGEIVGAVGQIAIAILAVYVAWQQYVISRDLTIQQNRITQQQTIDAYFQGVSDLTINDEGLLEDWPQERAIAEGRTAAILSSVDAAGKAKIVRFLSQSRLLSPLKRDRRLGRPILDGSGGYSEDREYGTRVIDLSVMLAAADLTDTDLRWAELSDANLVRADLSYCDLVKANLSRAILYEAKLCGADLKGTRLFYGDLETATPRTRGARPNYQTGEGTGAVVEDADFTDVQRMSEEQRQYCCQWCGDRSRLTIPGGCDGIPNRLGR